FGDAEDHVVCFRGENNSTMAVAITRLPLPLVSTPTAQAISKVLERIQQSAQVSGRTADQIRLIAVAKTATPKALQDAWAIGHRDFGHNRFQAMEAHASILPTAQWHFLGPLQGNKVRKATQLATALHTLDSQKLLSRLDRLNQESGAMFHSVLVQVNLNPEDGRAGLAEDALLPFLEHSKMVSGVGISGLMTLPPRQSSELGLRKHFATIRKLSLLASKEGLLPSKPELSMGMSGDFEIAIEEGATLVRIGRALFPPTNSPELDP
ncbi:MAG: YggS family pyridoxal phosphate-dependent enzyme, partial [Planctomycetes bacterium]|nr:YggS family pyridoxal phosphate-dependent enzyme [Planctomycetota bacterium]